MERSATRRESALRRTLRLRIGATRSIVATVVLIASACYPTSPAGRQHPPKGASTSIRSGSPGPFPAQNRVDSSRLVVYQMFLNYFTQNPSDDQPSVSVFANAQARLPSIAQLGVTMIQLSPFTPFLGETTPGNVPNPPGGQSPYSTLDYYDVNPGYAGFPHPRQDPGTPQLRNTSLAAFVSQAHSDGMEVIMDCVFHSTAKSNILVTQHPDYYLHDKGGNFVTNKYNMYEFDYSNPDTVSYMVNMVEYWRRTAGIDGCRSDAAAYVPLSFWAMLNNEMKKIDPSWFQVAEAENADIATYAGTYSGPGYQPGEIYENVFGFDAVYGVTWMVGMRSVLNGKVGSLGGAASLQTAWQYPEYYPSRNTTPVPPGTVIYRSVDNHDQYPRATLLAGGNSGMIAATAVDMTSDGIPYLFDGQEIGDTASVPIKSQDFISWANPLHPEDAAAISDLAVIRSHSTALQSGSTSWNRSSDPTDVVSYTRSARGQSVVVIVNLSPRPFSGTLSGTALSGALVDMVTVTTYHPGAGGLTLSLAPYSYVIANVGATTPS